MVHPISGNNSAYNPMPSTPSQAVKDAVKDLNQILSNYTNVKNPIIDDKYVGRLTKDLQILAQAYQADSGSDARAGDITTQCNLVISVLTGKGGHPPYNQNSPDAPNLSNTIIDAINDILSDTNGT